MNDGQQKLNVQWQKPDPSNGVILGYNISWRINDKEGIQFSNQTILTNTTNYTIDGLRACQVYNVTVFALTSAGAGPPSSALNSTYVNSMPNMNEYDYWFLIISLLLYTALCALFHLIIQFPLR